RRQVQPVGQRIDDRLVLRRRRLDQAQPGPVGGFTHELGVHGDEGRAFDGIAERRQGGVVGDGIHEISYSPATPPSGKSRRATVRHSMEPVPAMTDRPNGLTYADAGVDIDAGEALVDAIKPLAKATRRPGAEPSLGGFGALFDLKAAGYDDPLIVTTTDGVGTKLRIAIDTHRHDHVGIDLVAMCVNDLLAQGAEPLMFLDYYATSKLEVDVARRVVAGIAEGCLQAGGALVGVETAEMPGMYEGDDYDLAGFSVGAVDRNKVLPKLDDQREGDLIIGIASSGPHSNGYSLIRKVIEVAGLT